MRRCLFAVWFLGLACCAAAQESFSFARAENRTAHDRRLDSLIRTALERPLDTSSANDWRKAFWAMELMLVRNDWVQSRLKKGWAAAPSLPEDFQKALMEATHTLYPDVFRSEVRRLMETAGPAVFLRGAVYLHRADPSARQSRSLLQLAAKRFSDTSWIGFRLLRRHLQQAAPPMSFSVLLQSGFLPGAPVLFSLQRPDRDHPGLVLIRRPDGRFLRDSSGAFFHVPQLARAITNYPYFITNGNTPQGIYRWTGFDSSSNAYIGPTTNLQLWMPVEANPERFFGDTTLRGRPWTEADYRRLLPRGALGDALMEAYWAGSIGRSEIILHGTAIDPRYYEGQPYAPQTPSMGCLCTYEEWDPSGRRVRSDQQRIVDALKSMSAAKGYVVVVELKGKGPVRIEEVAAQLR